MRNDGKLIFLLLVLFSANVFAELADPTQPTIGYSSDTYAAGDKLQLNAIMNSGKEPVAIINGSLLKVNEAVGGYTVTRIDKDSVTLNSKNNGRLQLSMQSLDFKKPHHD